MVYMVQPATNSTTDKLVFADGDGKDTGLTGTAIVPVSGRYRLEH